jgi:hypothetical protein
MWSRPVCSIMGASSEGEAVEIGKPRRVITVEPAPEPATEPLPVEPEEQPVPSVPDDR